MSDFRVFMWMMFTVFLASLGLIAFGDDRAQEIGGGIATGIGTITFLVLVGKSLE